MSTDGQTLGRANREFPQHFPKPGWVEHEPEEIWDSVRASVADALGAAGARGTDIAAIGITNQRETTLLWERKTGKPVHRAIVWQDRRTAADCLTLKEAGHEDHVRATTGLLLDPYFSGTKLAWILREVDGARPRAQAGELAFGTVDSYLVWRLAGGPDSEAPHVTDVTNASRTLLMNLGTCAWDDGMRELLGVPSAVLPKIVPNAGEIARTRGLDFLPDGVPIAGMAGDQQAALFGQACFAPGDVKCTYGTGAFVVVNTGNAPVASRFGLLSTIGWQIGSERTYALEGSCFIAGAAVQWLRDGLGIIRGAADIEELAGRVESSDGVVFVPALAGLGAPHWDPDARGTIVGITRGTTAAHLARATLEAIAHQVDDLVGAMRQDLGKPIVRMRVDGGAAANDVLMRIQSDLSNVTVERPAELETTARGAAMLAGVGVGLFAGTGEAARMSQVETRFEPQMTPEAREARRRTWNDAVARSRGRLAGGFRK
jgi:glycerol kinase